MFQTEEQTLCATAIKQARLHDLSQKRSVKPCIYSIAFLCASLQYLMGVLQLPQGKTTRICKFQIQVLPLLSHYTQLHISAVNSVPVKPEGVSRYDHSQGSCCLNAQHAPRFPSQAFVPSVLTSQK